MREAGDDNEIAELVRAVDRIMRHADEVRRMGVRTNADTPEDAARARRMGAEGIGLCRTEHMFLGERKRFVEQFILAEDEHARWEALDQLLPLQRKDFIRILEKMDGLPVTIRLLDPPLHEFLPDLTELEVRVALAEERGEPIEADLRLLHAVRRMHEANPMLGLRGVRLGLVVPGLFALQVRAIAEAACFRQKLGGDPRAEIMIPLVGSVQELELVVEEATQVLQGVAQSHGCNLQFPIGTMIELPRAALTAGRIAEAAEFFSFGTNDLTQTTWGFSRDDVEGNFFSNYLEKGVFGVSPFETLDTEGVGRGWCASRCRKAGRRVRTCTSGCAASTAGIPIRSTSSTRQAWTTSPAARSGCRSPARGGPIDRGRGRQRHPLRRTAGGPNPRPVRIGFRCPWLWLG